MTVAQVGEIARCRDVALGVTKDEIGMALQNFDACQIGLTTQDRRQDFDYPDSTEQTLPAAFCRIMWNIVSTRPP